MTRIVVEVLIETMRDILLKHNRHWAGKRLDIGVKRLVLEKILDALAVRHIIAISGARRSGKSYIFRQIQAALFQNGVKEENVLQINFEDPYFIHRKEDPSLLADLYTEYLTAKNVQGKQYVFLDEIQNIKNWQYWLRDMYDQHEHIKFFVTGSNADMLSVEIDSHLTGRVISYENFPFSFKELLISHNDSDINIPVSTGNVELLREALFHEKEKLLYYLERTFCYSFYPEVCNLENAELATEILNQYFTNVIFKDIIPRFSIRNSRVIEELAYYLSTNFTSEFSYNGLGKIVGSNENTVKDYITYLEKAYLFYVVPLFEYSLKKQIRREKKIYIGDVGLRTATAFQFSPDAGRYIENIVFNAIRSRHKKVYYWKSKANLEIDFIYGDHKRYTAINVCYSDTIPSREFKGFTELKKEKIETSRNIIVSKNRYDIVEKDGIEIEILPVWSFLLGV